MKATPSKSIAVNIQSEVQLFSIEPLLDSLRTMFSDVKIVLDSFASNQDGYEKMAEGVVKTIKKHGLTPEFSQNLTNQKFDVYLTPYTDDYIKADCYLKYEYGTLNIKPILTYIPTKLERFHGFLCQSTITSSLLSCYGKTFPVDNLRFYNKKPIKHNSTKKCLLFAPTFNSDDSFKDIKTILQSLKSKYHIIIKSHHGTQYLNSNQKIRHLLKEYADEYYEADTSLSDLILKSDVCLFGNSSAIAEALYAKIPCAIFAHDLNFFKYGSLNTTQYAFVKSGYIPFTNQPKKIDEIIKQALNPDIIKKQAKLSKKIFPATYHTGLKGYLNAIEYFLYSEEAKDYIIFHDEIFKSRQAILDVEKRNFENAKKILENYESGKLYKVATKLYQLEGRIRHVKS